MNKQIVVTSTASLSNGEKIAVRKCSEPEDDLLQIYDTLQGGPYSNKGKKICVDPKCGYQKNESWKSGG